MADACTHNRGNTTLRMCPYFLFVTVVMDISMGCVHVNRSGIIYTWQIMCIAHQQFNTHEHVDSQWGNNSSNIIHNCMYIVYIHIYTCTCTCPMWWCHAYVMVHLTDWMWLLPSKFPPYVMESWLLLFVCVWSVKFMAHVYTCVCIPPVLVRPDRFVVS